MDFGTLLHTAKRNEQEKPGVRYYSTKFAPPKKEKKESKALSANIQKFLARKEAEEKHKADESRKKREELLALRSQDKKATRRVSVMLKRTKSANKSVIEDAVDKDNTAVTLVGPSQPDEDDYGYVSQEASAFYNKMMEKYSKMPDEPLFKTGRKKVSTNLINTKDRVKAALEKEKEESMLPHKRKRRREDKGENAYDSDHEEERNDSHKVKAKPAPPPLNFNELLKLAAQKQHEPIVIEVKPKDDEGPLLTKKQKKQQEMERQWREGREAREKEKLAALKQAKDSPKPNTSQSSEKNNRIPKVQKPTSQNGRPQEKKLEVIPKVPQKLDVKPKNPVINAPKIQEKKPANSTPKPLHSNNRPQTVDRRNEPVSNGAKRPLPQNVNEKFKKPVDLKQKQLSSVNGQRPLKKKPVNNRRILDDEDYDSEMDDFIDDGPEEDQDYSRHIKDIFGYDRNKYRGMDDDVDNMESTFAQQMREDIRSTKIGIMEDLEDMMKEREDKRRKAMVKKGKV